MEIQPLKGSFMIVSMFGFILSFIYAEDLGPTWSFTFMFFFILAFISSIVSMAYGGPDPQLMKKSDAFAKDNSPLNEPSHLSNTKR